MSTAETDTYQELALRSQTGITVRLLWDDATNEIWLSYADRRDQDEFATVVPAKDALEAFHHPNAYRPSPTARWCRS